MAKQRAVGADVVILICAEAAYGVAPDGAATGVYTRPALKSSGLGGSQPLEGDALINTGNADDSDPSLGAFDASGSLVAPLDARGAGFWLTMALGAEDAPVDEGGGEFSHTWTSGKDLKSYAVQTAHPKLTTPKYRTVLGAKAGGFSLPMQRNGRALMTIPMTGQSEVKDVAIHDAAPKVFVRRPFDNAGGSVKIGGVALANVIGATLDFSNGLDPALTIRADNFIDGVDETQRVLTGSLNLRLGTDHTIDDLIDAEGAAVVEFALALKAAPTWKLAFSMARVFFELSKKPVDGPGGIQATVNFRTAYDDINDIAMLTATLFNDVAAY
ncbi:MAG: hypothetical protein HY834_08920 [Devosia nanyangense]|uniref:Uncharacterized protein n=1 Tax=Devosia nanyangense TaxID=1228055 RepID=A0A933L2Z9_9HYPH|nr:hypothetical protein [Devosia nanyangense]